MKFDFGKNVTKFQEGGAMEQAPQDPMAELLTLANEAVQTNNCQAAVAVCTALLQIAQPPQEGGAPQGEPVFAKGGKLSKRV